MAIKIRTKNNLEGRIVAGSNTYIIGNNGWKKVRYNIMNGKNKIYCILLQNANELEQFAILVYYNSNSLDFKSEDANRSLKLYSLMQSKLMEETSQGINMSNLKKYYENISKRVKRPGKGMDSD